MDSNTKSRFTAKRIIAIFLSILMIGSVMPVSMVSAATEVASGLCGSSAHWSLDTDGLLTISGTGEMKNYYYGADNTPPWLEYREQITSVRISYGIKKIGSYAFGSPYEPGEDGYEAASFPNLRGNISLPSTVQVVGYGAFRNTLFDGTLTFQGNQVKYIEPYAFYNMPNLTGTVTIPYSVLGIGVISPDHPQGYFIGEGYAFANCPSLTGLDLSHASGLQNIEKYAFCNDIGLTGDLNLSSSSSLVTIGEHAFDCCWNLDGNLTFNNNIQGIHAYAFANCYKLKGDLNLPSNLNSFGKHAFENCYSLSGTLVIPPNANSYNTQNQFKENFVDAFHKTAMNTDPDQFFANYSAYIDESEFNNSNKNYISSLFSSGDNLIVVVENTVVEATPEHDGTVHRKYYCGYIPYFGSCSTLTYIDDVTQLSYMYERDVTVPFYASVASLSVSPETATIYTGSTQQITVTASPEYATNKDVTYTSSDTNIATVNSTGLVQGVAEGTATITVASVDNPDATATVTITVVPAPVFVSDISVSPSSVTMYQGRTEQLTTTVTPSNADNTNVTYVSADPNVATVNANGLITAVGVGSTTITVSAADGSGCTKTVPVTVKPIALTVSPDAIFVTSSAVTTVGETVDEYYTEQITVDNPAGGEVTYESSNPDLVTVSDTGLVSCKRDVVYGAYITVTAHNNPDETKIIPVYGGISRYYDTSDYKPYGQCGDTVWWYYDDTSNGGLHIFGYGDMWDLDAADAYGFNVRNANTGEFHYGLYSLDIGEGVTSIGTNSFRGRNWIIPAGTSANGSQVVMFPSSMERIGDYAFYNTSNVYSIIFDVSAGNLKTIGDYAFSVMRFPTSRTTTLSIPASVESIGESAFANSGFNGNLYLYGSSLKTIGNKAFNNNKFTAPSDTLIIPSSVEWIGDAAFKNAFSTSVSTHINSFGTSLKHIGSSAFENFNGTWSGRLPDTLKYIGDYAFNGCSNLGNKDSYSKRLRIPNSVEYIGTKAFYNCSSLTTLKLGTGIVTIGDSAFEGCTALGTNKIDASPDIIIPDSVKTIGNRAFYNLYNLDGTFSLGSSVETIGNYAFYSMRAVGDLDLPDTLTTIGAHAFHDASHLTGELNIPASVTSVGECAFHGAAKLEDIEGFFANYTQNNGDDPNYIRIVEKNRVEPTTTSNGSVNCSVYCTDPCHTTDSSALIKQYTKTLVYKPVEAISATPNPIETRMYDPDIQLEVTITPNDATNSNVTYTSSNNNIVSVSSTGLITATGEGNAVITVASEENPEIKCEIPVLVNPFNVTATVDVPTEAYQFTHDGTTAHSTSNVIVINGTDTVTMRVYDILPAEIRDEVEIKVVPSSANFSQECTLSSSNNYEFSLSSASTAGAAGNYKVYAEFKPTSSHTGSVLLGTYYAVHKVPATGFSAKFVNGEDKIHSNSASVWTTTVPTFTVGDIGGMRVVQTPSSYSYYDFPKTFTVSSSDPSIFTIEADNTERTWTGGNTLPYPATYYNHYNQFVINAITPGTADVIITAADGSGITKTYPITVNGVPVSYVSFTGPYENVDVNESKQYNFVVKPDNATNKELTYTTSDPAIATVNEHGVVTGVAPGSVTITATSVDDPSKSASRTITVNDVIARGQCGDDAWWSINTVGELHIYGTGPMWDFTESDYRPTYEAYKSSFSKVVIDQENYARRITHVGNYAFYNYENLLNGINIPNNVDSIGDYAFSGCTSLTGSITLGEGLRSIGSHAFFNSYSLCNDLTIPNSMQTIGDSAFEGTNLNMSLKFNGYNLTSIGSRAFYGTRIKGDVNIKGSSSGLTIGDSAFENCKQLNGQVRISDDCTSIGNRAFYGCDQMTLYAYGDSNSMITAMPSSLTFIGNEAFYGCYNVTGTLRLPEGLSSDNVGYCAFHGCAKNTDILKFFEEHPEFIELEEIENVAPTVTQNGHITYKVNCSADVHETAESKYLTDATVDVPYVFITSIDLTPDVYPITVNRGETVETSVTVYPDNATNKNVTYSVEDTNIATVDENGVITGVNNGSTMLHVVPADGSNSAEYTKGIQVNSNWITNINVDPYEYTLDVGEVQQIGVTVSPEDHDDKLIFESGDTNIVTVDEDGKITGVAPGSTYVYISSRDGYASYNVYVNVLKKVSDFTCNDQTVKVDESVEFTIDFTPSDATNKNLNFEYSGNFSIGYYGENRFYINGGSEPTNGPVTVTATTTDGSNISKTFTVTVYSLVTDVVVGRPLNVQKLVYNPAVVQNALFVADADSSPIEYESNPLDSGKSYSLNADGSELRFANVPAVTDESMLGGHTLEDPVFKSDEENMYFGYENGLLIVPMPYDMGSDVMEMDLAASENYEPVVEEGEPVEGEKVVSDANGFIVLSDANGDPITFTENPLDENSEYSLTLKLGEQSKSITLTVLDPIAMGATPEEAAAFGDQVKEIFQAETVELPCFYNEDTNILMAYVDNNVKAMSMEGSMGDIDYEASLVPTKTTPATIEVEERQTLDLEETIIQPGSLYTDYSAVTADTDVATFDDGKLTGVVTGETTLDITLVNGDGTPFSKTYNIKVTPRSVTAEITVAEDPMNLNIGESKNLEAAINPDDGETHTFAYVSSDPAIATVDENGKVTGVAEGSVTVTVTSDDLTKEVTVNVSKVPVTEISSQKSQYILSVGEEENLDASALPNNASDKTLAYASSDPSVLTVDAAGKMTGVGAGTANITISAENGTVTKTIAVVVADVTVTANTSLRVGDTSTITVALADAIASNDEIAISKIEPYCNEENEITLNDTTVTAIAIGSEKVYVDVTVRWNRTGSDTKSVLITKELNFTVSNTPVSDLTVDAPAIIEKGKTGDINATVVPADATDTGVIFESSDETIATVDTNGKVTAIAPGTVTITVKSHDGEVEKTADVIIADVTASYNKTTLNEGENATATVAAAPSEKLTVVSVTGTSSDPTVLTVGENGAVTAVKGGTATVTLTITLKDENDNTITVTRTVDFTVNHIPEEARQEDPVYDPDNNTYSFDLVTRCENDDEELDRETVTLTHHDEVPATVNAEGTIEYFAGDDGNNYVWNDDAGMYDKVTDLSIPKLPVTPVDQKDPTVNEYGEKAHFKDEAGNKYLDANNDGVYEPSTDEELRIDKVPVTPIDQKDPTVNEYGEKAHFEDPDGHKYVDSNNDGIYEPTTDEELRIDKLPVHTVDEVPATVNEYGEKEHFEDEDGNKYLDANNDGIYEPATDEELRIDKLPVTPVDQKDPTVNECGEKAHFEDEDGNKYLDADNDGVYEPTTDEELRIDKVPVTPVDQKDPTVNEYGEKTHFEDPDGHKYVDSNNDGIYEPATDEELRIDKLPVHTVDEVPATVNEYGEKEHFEDEDGNKYLDANNDGVYEPATDEELRIDKLPVHTVDEVPATVNEYGEKEHFEDEAGNKYLDANNDGVYEPATDEELRIDKLPVTPVDQKDPTVNEDGEKAHYEDEDGNKYLDKDGDGKYEPATDEELRIPKLPVTPVDQKDPTVNEDGEKAHFEDEDGNKYLDKDGDGKYEPATDDELRIPKLPVTPVDQKDPTINEDGEKAHFEDEDGNKYLDKDGDGKYEPATDEELRIPKLPVTPVDQKDPTVNEDGEKAHFEDEDGNKYLDKDGDGKYEPATDDELRIPKLPVTPVDQKDPTINEYGEKAHFEDEDGNKYLDKDGDGKYEPATDDELRIDKLPVTPVPQKDPTFEEDGEKAHFEDEDGNKYLDKDGDGKYESATDEELRIDKLVPVTSIDASISRDVIYDDELQNPPMLTIVVGPENASDKNVTVTVSDPSVAKIVDNRVLPLKDGVVTITVRSVSNPDVFDTVTLTIKLRTDFTANVPSSVKQGEEITINPVATKGEIESYEITSSDTSVAVVDGNKVKAVGVGTSVITIKVRFTDGSVVTKSYTVNFLDAHAGEFRCKRCDWYDQVKDSAGIFGFVYWMIHTITHLVQSIGFLT